MNRTFLPLCFILLASPPTFAGPPPPFPLPILIPDDLWHPLQQTIDRKLQKKLEERLNRDPLWSALIRNKHMAVGLVDLNDLTQPRFARINGNVMMYAASLPKIAILLSAFQAIEDGVLEETESILSDLHSMIRTSSNVAATRLIDLLGFKKIRDVLTDPRHRFFDPHRGGGLWVGKRYAKTGRVAPDPLKGLSHAATVEQVCRFYYQLATGRLINPQRSFQMLEALSNPGIHHKFVHTLETLAPRAQLFRKSGTWKKWHADSVLVWGEHWRRYILVGIVEDPRGGKILEDLVPAVEEVLRTTRSPLIFIPDFSSQPVPRRPVPSSE